MLKLSDSIAVTLVRVRSVARPVVDEKIAPN